MRNKKNQIKILISILALTSVFFGYQALQGYKEKVLREENNLKIGFITDAHFDFRETKIEEGKKMELNWQSKEALEYFVKKMNTKFRPDIVMEGGDFINGADDDSVKTWVAANKIFKNIKGLTYHVLGNHEVNTIDKHEWLRLTNYDKTYYYKDIDKKHKKFRVVVLDGNFFIDGKPTEHNSYSKLGYINDEQLEWLIEVLTTANNQQRDVIIFIHQPPLRLFPKTNDSLFPQREALQKIFARYKVRAVFSGHIERLCNVKKGNVNYFTLQGFWKDNRELKKEFRFKNSGSFYYITISPDDIDAVMEYRKFDKTIKGHHEEQFIGWHTLNVSEEYDCQGGRQLKQ
jgi:predicted MPP superfamily phosphohydrolase